MSRSQIKLPIVCLLIGAAAGGSIACATAQGQPNMYNALQSLRNARAELYHATPNKGGHRERAISLVDQAIGETEAGIAYGGN
jgi:hypothetical protein